MLDQERLPGAWGMTVERRLLGSKVMMAERLLLGELVHERRRGSRMDRGRWHIGRMMVAERRMVV
jgi:hypothetical protein